jgi:hypothetical protein
MKKFEKAAVKKPTVPFGSSGLPKKLLLLPVTSSSLVDYYYNDGSVENLFLEAKTTALRFVFLACLERPCPLVRCRHVPVPVIRQFHLVVWR